MATLTFPFITQATVGGPACNVPADYLTIQAAVTDPGCTTINVAAGIYNEQVQITRTLTLNGAKAGVDARTRSTSGESVITNACGPVQIMADNVVIDGFTIEGSTNSDPCFISGIWTNPGFSGTQGGHQILNNIVQNNISGIELDSTCVNPTLVQFNLIQNNNNPGPGSGNAIQTNFGLCMATIDSNRFSGHTNSSILIPGVPSSNLAISNNELVGGTSERIVFGSVDDSSISGNFSSGSTALNGPIRLFGGDNNIAISGNVLINGVRGIKVDDPFGIGPNSNVTAHLNCIVGNSVAGLDVPAGGHSGTLNAENNWWGAPSGPNYNGGGPGTGDKILDPDGVVDFIPFLTSPTAAPCPAPTTALTTKQQAMNGDQKVAQGSTLYAGFDFTMPDKHPATMVGFSSTTVSFPATCASGTPGSTTIVVTIPNQSYTDPANSSAWLPSGDQNSAATYQGSATVPPFCDPGALVRLQKGGTFSTQVSAAPGGSKVNLRWHYKDGTGGGWSGTYSVTP